MGVTKFLPGIAWFLFVLFLICIPGKDLPDTGWLNSINFDKIVHGGLFGGIVFLFCRPFRQVNIDQREKINLFIRITMATCVWGLTTEFIQKFFVPGRSFDLLDWAADSTGAMLSYYVCKKYFAQSGQPQ